MMSLSFTRLVQFGNGDLRRCPLCGAAIERFELYEKVEPDTYSLYVQPCNHRLGLWSNAPKWNEQAGLPVDIIRLEDD